MRQYASYDIFMFYCLWLIAMNKHSLLPSSYQYILCPSSNLLFDAIARAGIAPRRYSWSATENAYCWRWATSNRTWKCHMRHTVAYRYELMTFWAIWSFYMPGVCRPNVGPTIAIWLVEGDDPSCCTKTWYYRYLMNSWLQNWNNTITISF